MHEFPFPGANVDVCDGNEFGLERPDLRSGREARVGIGSSCSSSVTLATSLILNSFNIAWEIDGLHSSRQLLYCVNLQRLHLNTAFILWR